MAAGKEQATPVSTDQAAGAGGGSGGSVQSGSSSSTQATGNSGPSAQQPQTQQQQLVDSQTAATAAEGMASPAYGSYGVAPALPGGSEAQSMAAHQSPYQIQNQAFEAMQQMQHPGSAVVAAPPTPAAYAASLAAAAAAQSSAAVAMGGGVPSMAVPMDMNAHSLAGHHYYRQPYTIVYVPAAFNGAGGAVAPQHTAVPQASYPMVSSGGEFAAGNHHFAYQQGGMYGAGHHHHAAPIMPPMHMGGGMPAVGIMPTSVYPHQAYSPSAAMAAMVASGSAGSLASGGETSSESASSACGGDEGSPAAFVDSHQQQQRGVGGVAKNHHHDAAVPPQQQQLVSAVFGTKIDQSGGGAGGVGSKYCQFCLNNGEPESVYRGHVLRDNIDGRNKVVCPVLRAYNCPLCHSGGGDQAHTKSYCPLLRVTSNTHGSHFTAKFQGRPRNNNNMRHNNNNQRYVC